MCIVSKIVDPVPHLSTCTVINLALVGFLRLLISARAPQGRPFAILLGVTAFGVPLFAPVLVMR